MIRPLTFLFHLGYRPDQVLFSSMCEDNIHPYEHPLYRCIPALNKTVTHDIEQTVQFFSHLPF